MPSVDNELRFRLWLNEVDAILKDECGLTHEDLPDQCYRDMFDAGDSAEDAARVATEEL